LLKSAARPFPFFVANSRLVKADEAIVRFEGVDGEPEAQAMVGRGLWLPESLLPELNDDQFYYHELPGFRVVNTGVDSEMSLVQVVEYPAQDLFEIKVGGREQHVLIPVIDPFIERVDKPGRTIYLCAPEELYSL